MPDNTYDVAPEKLREIFDEYIKDLVFSQTRPAPPGERPVMVQLGGQLAAGKSHALRAVIERHQGQVALVSPDDFRAYHPDYLTIMRERPQEMAALTGKAMYAWTEMVREHAHAHGLGIVTESTFRRTEDLLRYSAEMGAPAPGQHSGFDTEVVVVATPGDRSCLDMVKRYLADPPGQGRWADSAGHDASYNQLPTTVDALENSPHVRRVIVTDREGALHYENTRGADGTWQHEPRAAQVLQEVRGDGAAPFGQQEAQGWLTQYWEHAEQLINRGELNAVTAPTMQALHERADRIASFAHAGNEPALAEHRQWQDVQKQVFSAAGRGASNTELPSTPKAFLEASPEQRKRFDTALRTPTEAAGPSKAAPPVSARDAALDAARLPKKSGPGAKKPPPSSPAPGKAPQAKKPPNRPIL